jgi:hypothetical protein
MLRWFRQLQRRSNLPGLWLRADGQAIVFVVLILFVLICFIGLTINVGHRVSKKIELQNAADAAAMSGAIWIARGLNLISILNVSMTEILAFIIFLEAVKKGNAALYIIYPINLAAAAALAAFPLTAAVGEPWLASLQARSSFVTDVYPQMDDAIGSHDQSGTILGTLWDLMDGIASAERAIQNIPPVLALANAQDIGQLNGADLTLLLPPDFELPVIEGEFNDLCQPTKEDGGGPGYRNFLCWEGGALSMPSSAVGLPSVPFSKLKDYLRLLWLPVDTSPLVPPIASIYGLLVDAAYSSLCGGGSTSVTYPLSTLDCEECADNNGRDVTWVGARCKIDVPSVDAECVGPADDLGDEEFNDFDAARFFFETQGLTQRMRPPDPSEPTSGGACSYFDLDTQTETVTDPNTNTQTTVVEHYKTEWVMTNCTYDSADEVSVGTPSNRPTPLMIDPDWVSRSEYLALSTMAVDDQVTYTGLNYEGPTQTVTLGDAGERQTISVGQVKVYNATGADLFNQDWRVRLVPVDLGGLNTDVTQFLSQYPIFNDALGLFLSH